MSFKHLPIIVILLGIALRLSVFSYNRSFFIDEANLARNVVEKSSLELFAPLSYEQYAPPLFLLETKLVTKVLGSRDICFRIIPLLSGFASLFLIWLLLKRFLVNEYLILYGLALISFSFIFIRYATEFKQYSSDALLTLLLTWLSIKLVEDKKAFDIEDFGAIVFLGALGIWYSMPMFFILPTLLLFLFCSLNDRRVLLALPIWAISGLLYYYLNLRLQIDDTNIQSHFAERFIRIDIWNIEAWRINANIKIALFREVLDKTTISLSFGALCILASVYAFYKQKDWRIILLLMPLVLMAIASALKLYPISARLTLFVIPLITILLCYGLEWIWKSAPKGLRFFLVALMLFTIVNKKAHKLLLEPMNFEDTKLAIQQLSELGAHNSCIHVHDAAVPAFEFYTKLTVEPYHFSKVNYCTWKTPYADQLAKGKDCEQNWYLVGHLTQDEERAHIEQVSKEIYLNKYAQYKRASLYKF